MMDPRETIFRISPPSSTAIVTTQETVSTKQEDENESVRLALRSEPSRPLLRQLFARCSTSSSPRHVFLRLLWMSRCLFAAPEAAPRVWTIDLCDAIESANMYLARSSQEHHLAFWEAFVHAVTIISERVFPSKSRKEALSHTVNLLLASPPSMLLPEIDVEQYTLCVSRLVLKPFEESTELFRTIYERYSRGVSEFTEKCVHRILHDFELCPLQISATLLERHVIRARIPSTDRKSSKISFAQFMEILARCAVDPSTSSSSIGLEVCARRFVELFRERANSVIPPKSTKVKRKKRVAQTRKNTIEYLLNNGNDDDDNDDDDSQASHWLFLRYASSSRVVDIKQWLRFCEDVEVFGHCNLPCTDSVSIFLKTMRTSSNHDYENTTVKSKLELNSEDFQRALRAMCTRVESSPRKMWEITRRKLKSRRWYVLLVDTDFFY